jgi:hypothetical protein
MFSAFSAPVYSQAQPDWTMEAFEKQRVTIVATTHFNDLVAGTDSGLYMHRGSQWLKLDNTYAPVRDIEMLDSFKMALAMGEKGQDLAGIYIGNFLWAMGIYSFTLIDTLSSPVSVAVKGPNGDTIFAGSKDRIVQTVRKTDGAYEKFTTQLKFL